MSRFIVALVVFSLILSFSLGSVFFISNKEEKLQKQLDKIELFVKNGEMQGAEQAALDFLELFDQAVPRFVMLIRRTNIDEITKYASKLPVYCKYDERAEAMAEIRLIKSLLEHISNDEKASLHNFF